MNFFKDVISSLLKLSDDGSVHSSFKVCDPTAIGDNPVRELSLDVVNLGDESGNSIVSLAWKDSAEKILEKQTSSEEASHISQLIQTDLAQVMKLTGENQYDEAKEVFKNMLKTYTQDTSTPTPTNLPPLHNTQAEQDIDAGLWKVAKISLRNIFPSGTVQQIDFEDNSQLKEYTDSMKGNQSGKEVPLWEQEGKNKTPAESGELAPASLSYEEIEEQKADDHQNMEKHIDEKIKQELESALLEKAASVFGPADEELVKSLRAPGIGRNWDEIKKIFTKNLNRDDESTTIFLDEQRKKMGDDGVEMIKEEPKPEDVLRPPKELVPDSVHEKLLQDLEDKKKDKEPIEETKEIEKVDEAPIVEESAKKSICPECNGEGDVPAVRGGHVVAISCPSCSGDKHIEHAPKELESAQEEIARADNSDIRKVALLKQANQIQLEDGQFGWDFILKDIATGETKLIQSDYDYPGTASTFGWAPCHSETDGTVDCPVCGKKASDLIGEAGQYLTGHVGEVVEDPGYFDIQASKKVSLVMSKVVSYMNISETDPIEKIAVDNPLQEPIAEEPTMETPEQDRIPFGSNSHRSPKPESWVVVQSDLKGELPAFRGKFVSEETESDGTKWGIVDKDGELLKVEMHRITPETEGAQTTDPIATPKIDTNIEQPINTIPSTEKLTSLTSELKEAAYDEKWLEKIDCADCRAVSSGHDRRHYCEKHVDPRYTGVPKGFYPEDKESSQDDLLTIKAEAEQLLKTAEIWNLETEDEEVAMDMLRPEIDEAFKGNVDAQNFLRGLWDGESWESIKKRLEAEGSTWYVWWMDGVHAYMRYLNENKEASKQAHKKSYLFIKKGLEKHADDSAFEGNGWCRVWVQEDEIAVDPKYPEALKLPDENARIVALKEIALKLAHESLRLADSAGAKVGVQSWFESLKPSDHDRIDWVTLASPQVEAESSLKQAKEIICEDCGSPFKGVEGETCEGCTKAEEQSTKQASDFEKGISQNKTADEPAVEPKTQYKELKRAPAYVDREKAVPAPPELDVVLAKMDALEQNLATLDNAKKQIQAKMKEEIAKLEQSAERVQMEKELQESINKAGVLIEALESKVVSWRDKVYTLQTQEVSYVPNITPKEMLEKVYAKFEGAQKFVEAVLSGMKSQAVNVLEKTLVKFPGKKSSLNKEASVIDQWNDELLQALKELSSPL